MSRRQAREVALQVLFQLDFNVAKKDEALKAVILEHGDLSVKAKAYAETVIDGTLANLEKIDKVISDVSPEWKVERMAGVDRNIARIAIYEMRFADDILPPNVAINEAIELAKKFGAEESGRFLNGILGSQVKDLKK